MSEPYYSHHLFFCCNVREGERAACNDDGAAERLRGYAKDRIREWGLKGPGGPRANTAGCLGRCEEGPVLVVYPDATWYRYHSEADVDEILFEHVMNGRPVARLKIDD